MRKQRKSRSISTLATAAAHAADNTTFQLEMELQNDEVIQNMHYAVPAVVTQENIFDNPEHPTSGIYDNPAASPYETPAIIYESMQTGDDHVYDVPKVKKTSTTSLSLMRRKESKSKYERLSTAEEPGGDP